ncbi:hypothetical protein DES49_1784 [Halospina denitrificans]|uniref:Uncharacterized protein n=1 Tax=Halospina denitrificans TaxID=332522 RepID=A0A4R7JTL9_9GAMM|nr:hypothetical protein [Halospina denitrificans]TDT41682.1 hypothetical protein DES49_1784 [Halospina denitrificans]
MPTPEEILLGLEAIANDWLWLAALWHLYFAAIVLVLAFGVRPSRRTTGLLLTLPLLSVSLLAWLYANPFNGGIFAVAALALVVVSMKLPRAPVRLGPPWLAVLGGLMAGFGWVYPHFLTDSQPWLYLFAAPTGLLPCPTTSIVLGLSLVLGGLG